MPRIKAKARPEFKWQNVQSKGRGIAETLAEKTKRSTFWV
jgi:hypothetical protein